MLVNIIGHDTITFFLADIIQKKWNDHPEDKQPTTARKIVMCNVNYTEALKLLGVFYIL